MKIHHSLVKCDEKQQEIYKITKLRNRNLVKGDMVILKKMLYYISEVMKEYITTWKMVLMIPFPLVSVRTTCPPLVWR